MMDFLSVVWNVDPVIVKIGPLAIRYYSLLFIAGFPLGYWLFTSKYKAKIDAPIILHTKDLAVKDGVTCLPLYMAPML